MRDFWHKAMAVSEANPAVAVPRPSEVCRPAARSPPPASRGRAPRRARAALLDTRHPSAYSIKGVLPLSAAFAVGNSLAVERCFRKQVYGAEHLLRLIVKLPKLMQACQVPAPAAPRAQARGGLARAGGVCALSHRPAHLRTMLP